MMLTSPPTTLEPYSRVAGPRTTSIRSALLGSMVIPWWSEVDDRSPVRMPSSMMSTRSPPKPRMTGRLAPGPKLRLATPGSCSRASPMVAGASRAICSESTVVTALKDCSVAAAPTAAAVTVTSSRTGERLSAKSAVATPPTVTVTVRLAAVSRLRCAVTS